jgi:glucose-6-phosphate 1-dehydrogenase
MKLKSTGEPGVTATCRNIGERLTLGAGEALNAVFYLATPPSLFGPIGDQLGAGGLVDESSAAWRRIIVEKPFGRDLETAQALNRRMLSVVQEHQIYRIDHYLGKETVQNIMALRFGNGIFEPIWNRRYVDHVQICVAETVGVEQRGGYYDTAGALRDMLQNHLFQLLAVTTMEPPGSFRAEAVRNERLKVLQAVRPFTGNAVTRDVVRGQYTSGTLSGQAVPGYRSEPRVAPQSDTETYVALKVRIDTWRWAATHRLNACSPTGSCCASSHARASRCSSRPKCQARACSSAPSKWISATWTTSARHRAPDMKRCCTTA